MAQSIFDEIIDRKGTDSLKFDFAVRRGRPRDILPLWVADMDFRAPQCVIDAMTQKSLHGIFGYSESREDYDEVLRKWFKDRFNWDIQPQWLVKTPGVVYAISMAIRAVTKEGDAVLIQEPVYYPFSESIIDNGRQLVVNELKYDGTSYAIDFEDFTYKIVENQVKLFILCSPHNPVGRVWTEEELRRLGDICRENGVIVVSDEIHSDIIFPGRKHTVFSNVQSDFKDFTITCTAPSKTFNLASLQISNIFIPNPALRRAFSHEVDKSGYSQPNVMGITACIAAYSGGHAWLEELITYLTENLNYLRSFLNAKLSQVRLVEPEGTYLAWLDFRALRLNDKELENLIVHKAKLWLDGGTMFGLSGSGFQRINIACPRATLEKALLQLETAVKQLNSKPE